MITGRHHSYGGAIFVDGDDSHCLSGDLQFRPRALADQLASVERLLKDFVSGGALVSMVKTAVGQAIVEQYCFARIKLDNNKWSEAPGTEVLSKDIDWYNIHTPATSVSGEATLGEADISSDGATLGEVDEDSCIPPGPSISHGPSPLSDSGSSDGFPGFGATENLESRAPEDTASAPHSCSG